MEIKFQAHHAVGAMLSLLLRLLDGVENRKVPQISSGNSLVDSHTGMHAALPGDAHERVADDRNERSLSHAAPCHLSQRRNRIRRCERRIAGSFRCRAVRGSDIIPIPKNSIERRVLPVRVINVKFRIRQPKCDAARHAKVVIVAGEARLVCSRRR